MNEHYRAGNIQPIEAITDWSLGYNTGTAVAYIARHLKKGKPAEDLTKAIWHLVYELTEDSDVCDAIVDVVEENRSVDWVEEVVESPSCLGEYTDGGFRYVIRTDDVVCFDSDDFEAASAKFEAVSNKFHCSRAVFVDRGPVDGCDGCSSAECGCRCIDEWTEYDVR